jgi:hypothetical protein
MPFRDDFDGTLADQVGWAWSNEAPDRWSISDEGWLVIEADNPHVRGGISNMLTRSLPSEGDVIVTTLVRANADENFKQAALFLFNEDLDYVSILIGFCEPCVPATQGYGTFLEAFMGDQSLLPEPVFIPRDPANTEVTLRLEYSPDAAVVVGLYAYTPGEWVSAGIVRDVPPLTMVGIGAANLPGPTGSSFDMTAEYDYVDLELP